MFSLHCLTVVSTVVDIHKNAYSQYCMMFAAFPVLFTMIAEFLGKQNYCLIFDLKIKNNEPSRSLVKQLVGNGFVCSFSFEDANNAPDNAPDK